MANIRKGVAFLLTAIFLDRAIGSASAYTEVCTVPAKVFSVRTAIDVAPRDFPGFMRSLHAFAADHGYIIEPSASPLPTEAGAVDVLVLKNGTAEAIGISNRARRDVVVAKMFECGSTAFRPYWNEFMQFVWKYRHDSKIDRSDSH